MKEPKPITKEISQKTRKGDKTQTNSTKSIDKHPYDDGTSLPPVNINHKYTEQISLNSSDKEDMSSSSDDIKTGGKVFSSKSMSEIMKGDNQNNEVGGRGKSDRRSMARIQPNETSSCSYHERFKDEGGAEGKSLSLSELSENIRSQTELLIPRKQSVIGDVNESQRTRESNASGIKEDQTNNESCSLRTKEKKEAKVKQKEQIEIKRMKLISFLGNRINETPIEEIEEAISKMLFLTNTQFDNLLEDVLNQIEERTLGKRSQGTTNSLSSFSSKQSESKLVHLNSKQFKKLCLDVFYVFEAKYPSNRKNKYSEIIQNLETSLNEMTSRMAMMDETNEILFNIENERTPAKQLNIFFEYLKKVFLSHSIDTEVLIKFEDVYVKNFQNSEMCLNLLDPEFLLRFTENSFDMKIQAQRKIVYLLDKKYRKSIKNSQKLDSPYKHLLRKETVNLILLLDTKKITFKGILGNLSKLFNHLTYCCLNESNVFSKEALLLFKCIIRGLKEINERLNEVSLNEEFREFEEFNLKIKQEKLGKRVLNDELERLIVNLARKLLKLKIVY